MINKAYTARELAEMKLKDWPHTQQGFDYAAKKGAWQSRPREGRGGGSEYLFASLPVELQKAIITKFADESKLQELQGAHAEFHQVEQLPVSAEERRNAKMTIVALFNKFRRTCGMSILDAEGAFITLYQGERTTGVQGLMPIWLFDIYPEFSVQSLRRWRALNDKDVQKLGGRYGNRKGTSIIMRAENGEVANIIAAALVANMHLKAGHIRDLCRSKFGNTLRLDGKEIPMPKIRAFERHIATWKVENANVHEYLTNPDSYKNKQKMALGRADAHVHALNQEWQIDASPADVLCTDGRYSIYAIIDVWSRRALFSVSKTPRTEASLLLVRRAIMEWGVPETLKTDNGSDFVSKRFAAALLGLGINHDICPPYSPEKKPFVERVIKTLQHDLMAILPGFVGHSVADRKRIEAKKSFAQSLGESDEKAFSVALSHIELQKHIDEWTTLKYMQRPHSGIGNETPFARANSSKTLKLIIPNMRALDLLLSPIAGGDGWRVVQKKGLRIDNGQFYGAGLEMYVNKRVLVRHDPEDMGRVFVFNEDDEFVCEAIDHELLGINPAEAIAASKAKQKKFMADGTKELRRQARELTPAKVTRDILAVAALDAGNITAFPKQTENYTTAALDEAVRAVTKDKIPAERSAEEEARREAFQKEFQQRTEDNVVHVTLPAMDKSRWWTRAQALEAELAAGHELCEADQIWFERTLQRHWYKSRKELEAMKTETEEA